MTLADIARREISNLIWRSMELEAQIYAEVAKREAVEKNLAAAMAQIDDLLKQPGVSVVPAGADDQKQNRGRNGASAP